MLFQRNFYNQIIRNTNLNMRRILLFILLFFIGFNQAQVKQNKKLTGKKVWVNPVKLTKEEKARPYMSEVLKTRDSLTPVEAERRRKNIEAGNPFKKYGYYPKVATLSKGKYLEFHDQDSIVIIGSVKYNVKKDSISGLMEINLDDPDAQPIGDTHGRWISPDPLSEEFSSWSPYNYALNNPLRNADPTGMAPEDWVKDGNRIFFDPSVTGSAQVQAKYGSNAQSIEGYHVTKNGIRTSYALGQDGSISTNFANIVSTTTSVYQTGNIETGAATIEGQLGTSQATISGIPDSRGKTDIQMLVAENPLVQDAIIGTVTGGALNSLVRRATLLTEAAETVNYTKSSLSMGREMHKAYKLGEHAPELGKFKEFTGVKGIRPDFVDFSTNTIYELKPFNPRGMKSGAAQLEKYKTLFEKQYGGTWNTVLDHY
ncbi:hypothetical protein EGY07_11660 [Chryseobacterium indologenes]|nr:hypothetical protein EGY07_11660 [Chryseobacterium indologenes]